ncbi:MAG: sulfotransferase domain-containing protein [Planctomycetota bacterium]
MPERFPDFLIIGSMKSGTTTLFADLAAQNALFGPSEKELDALLEDGVLRDSGRREYAGKFKPARPDQLCFEASTGYTKHPEFFGAPARALELCGPALKLIYIIREPMGRIISHHHHWRAIDKAVETVDEAVRVDSRYLAWSRYAWQLDHWLDHFPQENVLLVRFNDLVKNRVGTSRLVCEFLGVACDESVVDPERVMNMSAGKPVDTTVTSSIATNPLYRKYVRPLLPTGLRDKTRRLLSARSTHEKSRPSRETVERVYADLAEDLERLRPLMRGHELGWSVESAIEKHCEPAPAGGAAC